MSLFSFFTEEDAFGSLNTYFYKMDPPGREIHQNEGIVISFAFEIVHSILSKLTQYYCVTEDNAVKAEAETDDSVKLSLVGWRSLPFQLYGQFSYKLSYCHSKGCPAVE